MAARRALTRLGRWPEAAGHLGEALRLAEEPGPPLEQALTLARRHRHRAAEVGVLDSLGYLAHRRGDHDGAMRWYRQCLVLQAEYQLPDTGHHRAVQAARVRTRLGQLPAPDSWAR